MAARHIGHSVGSARMKERTRPRQPHYSTIDVVGLEAGAGSILPAAAPFNDF